MVQAALDVYFLTCRVFDVCVMKIGFIIVLQHVTSTVGSMHIKSCLLVDSLWLCCRLVGLCDSLYTHRRPILDPI